MPAFKKGDIVVSEDREFRLIAKVSENGIYIWLPLKKLEIEDCLGRKITSEVLSEHIQPTSIVDKYFHLYELK